MYDVVVIGSGPAGYTAALEAAKHKLKTALIEKNLDNLGGTCLNEGCIPLKGLLHHSEHTWDYNLINSKVAGRIDVIRSGLLARIKAQGIEVIEGEAKFTSSTELMVNEKKIEAKNIVIAAGSSPKKIYDTPCVFSSDKVFKLDSLPYKVLIIGGGVIGCEYASFFMNMGCSVEIVEVMDTILYGEDEESIRTLAREMKKRRVRIHVASKATNISDDMEVTITCKEKEEKIKFDAIFETIGRVPALSGLDIEKAGIELTEKGFVKVNNNMQTSISNIYAAGDCIEGPMLAYTAYKEAETAIEHIIDGTKGDIDYPNTPYLMFSVPQVGSVGLKEKDLEEKGIEYDTYKYFFKGIGKAVVEEKDAGFIKLYVKDEVVIGATVVGREAVELMNELAIIVSNKLKVKDIRRTIHVHPSYSEIIVEALSYGKQ